jgi:flagellar protein FlbD
MIKLTRLDGEAFILNADLIRFIESRPDTFITLTTGDRVVVRESVDDVVGLAMEYQQRKHLMPLPNAANAPNPPTGPSLSRWT